MKNYRVWHSSDSDDYELELCDTPWWALATVHAVEALDAATGHRLCTGGPQVLWHLPLGWPRYVRDESGRHLDNSCAAAVWTWFGRCLDLEDRHSRTLLRLPLDDTSARVFCNDAD